MRRDIQAPARKITQGTAPAAVDAALILVPAEQLRFAIRGAAERPGDADPIGANAARTGHKGADDRAVGDVDAEDRIPEADRRASLDD